MIGMAKGDQLEIKLFSYSMILPDTVSIPPVKAKLPTSRLYKLAGCPCEGPDRSF